MNLNLILAFQKGGQRDSKQGCPSSTCSSSKLKKVSLPGKNDEIHHTVDLCVRCKPNCNHLPCLKLYSGQTAKYTTKAISKSEKHLIFKQTSLYESALCKEIAQSGPKPLLGSPPSTPCPSSVQGAQRKRLFMKEHLCVHAPEPRPLVTAVN